MKLKLTYIYHSGFAIQAPGLTILIDYWQDTAPGRGGESVTLEILPGERFTAIDTSNALGVGDKMKPASNEREETTLCEREETKLSVREETKLTVREDTTLAEGEKTKADEGVVSKGWVRRWLEEAPAGEAFYVLSSHFHADHFNPEVLTWRSLHPDIHYILSADIAKHRRAPRSAATFLHKGESYSDERLTVKAFGSTDVGVSFLLTLDGVTLFHAGDLNNWHWQDESTPEEVRKAEGDYLAELRNIQREVEAVDVAFFPVDNRMGSDYMRGARQFVEAIRVGLFVPMHYDEEVAAAAAFRPIAQANGAGVWMRPLPAPHKGG